MNLTRRQFDILEYLTINEVVSSQRDIAIRTNHSLGSVNKAIKELTELNYVSDGKITQHGTMALEPYRVKRAVFLAAGFGSRLVPITLNTPKPLVRVHGIRIIDRLIDACLAAEIEEIYIVRGYLGELFDQLLYKYPMIRFIENPLYNEANSIGSAMAARRLLSNAYVFEADFLISNPSIIRKYQYSTNCLGIKKQMTNDWCLSVKNGIVQEQKIGGEGDNIWQQVGISYWNEADGKKLCQDIADVFNAPGGKERYWDQVPLIYKRDHYAVEVRECFDEDIVEIDTFAELKAIDKSYDV